MGRKKDKKIKINLKSIIEKIKEFKRVINVEKAILFGSYAKGNVNENSDIDIILIGKKFRRKNFNERFRGLWSAWTLNSPVDFLYHTPEEFKKLKKRVLIVNEAVIDGSDIKVGVCTC